VTYEGQRRSFRDIQLGVDAFSIDQFSGPWRDLSSVLKNHIVWSVLKSLVGFRGKFVQSEIDQNSAVERAIERLRTSEDVDEEIVPARNVHSKTKRLETRKRRRFRPYKNAKKFLARLGVGAPYAPAARATVDGDDGDVLRSVAFRSKRELDDDEVFV